MEYLMKKIVTMVGLLLFAGCVWLIVDGQKSIGYAGLSQMMLGLAGILVIIWSYNRTHR